MRTFGLIFAVAIVALVMVRIPAAEAG